MKQIDTLGVIAWVAIIATATWLFLNLIVAFVEVESTSMREYLGGVFSLGDRVSDVNP